MSKLTEFYRGDAPDCEGRTLDDHWLSTFDDVEYSHNQIQWLFPTHEASKFNYRAPILTADDITIFKADPLIQYNLLATVEWFLPFLGMELSQDGEGNFLIIKANTWEDQSGLLFGKIFNHNHLRMTRVLVCLNLCGYKRIAKAIFDFLRKHCGAPENTWWHWERAMELGE